MRMARRVNFEYSPHSFVGPQTRSFHSTSDRRRDRVVSHATTTTSHSRSERGSWSSVDRDSHNRFASVPRSYCRSQRPWRDGRRRKIYDLGIADGRIGARAFSHNHLPADTPRDADARNLHSDAPRKICPCLPGLSRINTRHYRRVLFQFPR